MDEAQSESSPTQKRYGTVAGVFTPTLLTILGVIMFLRVGWVVGNAGLLGGWLIMLLAIGITTATGLSLSSIATNTRIGAGGPYAVIRKSLGLEVGGSVGVPLYLSQAVAVAMYIFGLREGWNWIFPSHSALVVDLVVFAIVVGIGWISAGLAFRIQYVVMAIIGLSLVMIFAAGTSPPPAGEEVGWWGTWPGSPENDFAGTDFWTVFAVFFPAATGVTVGSNMSGELKDPRRAIPYGTLGALAISSVIYFVLAWWVTRIASAEELVTNYTVLIDQALWGPAVLAGLLGATFSSALAAFVGAPRILVALGRDNVLPGGEQVAKLSPDGEPRRATAVTAVIVLLALMVRDLNSIAPMVTMFFLIAYTVINVVVVIESSLGLVSYRPTLKLPIWIPLLGTVGCMFAMFVVNPTFSMIALVVVMALYAWIMSRGLEHHGEDVRSGVFVAIAEWAARKVTAMDVVNLRAWKPNLLVPVSDPTVVRGEFPLLAALCRPEGSIKLLGIATEEGPGELDQRLQHLTRAMTRASKVFTTWSVVDSADYTTGVVASIQALGSAFFRPNVLALGVASDGAADRDLEHVAREARRLGVGVMLIALHRSAGLGRSEVVNLWFHPQDAHLQVQEAFDRSNLNLAILMALRLARSWGAELNLITVVDDQERVAAERVYLGEIKERARLQHANTLVMVGDFLECVGKAPQSDMDVFGMAVEPDLDLVRRLVDATRSSCLFISDSGQESAFA